MKKSPVLFIIFNRPVVTQSVFEAIRSAKPERLYIAADAPREGNDEDIEKCKQARLITENVDWPCEVQRLYQEKNLGCSLGPQTAFDWFFRTEKEGIILEDDCLPHSTFFEFASQMLEYYRDNSKIISINGFNFGFKYNGNESFFFSRFMNMWGWATWADRAQKIDYYLKDWKNSHRSLYSVYRMTKQSLMDTDINWAQYWKRRFDSTVDGRKVTWWDWQWIYYQLNNRLFSIVPAKNLVTNLGFNDLATHTKSPDNPCANLPMEEIKFPLIKPAGLYPDIDFEEVAIKYSWCYHKRIPLKNYLMNRLLNLFK